MGGLSGHISHLTEDLDLTFQDLLTIAESLLSGELPAFEKFDGQNIHVRHDDYGTVFARNQSHSDFGGLFWKEFIKKYEDHPAKEVFRCAETPLKILGTILADRHCYEWLNCEILDPHHYNIIEYWDECAPYAVAIHNRNIPLEMRQAIRDAEQYNTRFFKFLGPQCLEFAVDPASLYEFKRDVKELQSQTGAKSLREFARHSIKLHPRFPADLPAYKEQELICKILGEQSPTLQQIKQGLSRAKGQEISNIATVQNIPPFLAEVMEPVSFAIRKFSHRVCPLSHLLPHEYSVDRKISAAKKKIMEIDDQFREDRIKTLTKYFVQTGIDFDGRLKSEGFVFDYKGKTYKMTGFFGPVNMLCGLIRYGRGKIPRLE